MSNNREQWSSKASFILAAPPFSPAIYGNFQIFPSPTAEPAAAKMKLAFELHCSLLLLIFFLIIV
jgi:hypothetical protein